MGAQGIVNIINFIRGMEPRREVDLLTPVAEQMKLAKKHKLPVTWLVQYDAMIDSRFVDLLKERQAEDEVGIWLEFVQPLVEKAGIKWRGRFPWDWHVNAGFSVGYSVEERKRMVDIFIEDFVAVFGFVPKSAGSWFVDAATLGHLSDKYSLKAFCNCKDQWGTDGYTLWGGYFNQAYYPSRLNSYLPAQTLERQIPVPAFRMLGSDPIHQYEAEVFPSGAQSVITLEPVYPKGGGDPKWCDWFFDAIFKSPCLSFGYAQAGQENSFGWDSMEKGLIHQHKRLEEMHKSGLIRVETLSKSGEWFRSRYSLTPPSAVVAERDLERDDLGALWYCSNRYRASLLWEGSSLRLRDLQLFDESYAEPFLNSVCEGSACKYDALPILDGLLWSSKVQSAGIYLTSRVDGVPLVLSGKPEISEQGDKTLKFSMDVFSFTFEETSMELRGPSDGSWSFQAGWDAGAKGSFKGVDGGKLLFSHEGFDYSAKLLKGSARQAGNGFALLPDAEGTLKLGFPVR